MAVKNAANTPDKNPKRPGGERTPQANGNSPIGVGDLIPPEVSGTPGK